jgi:hypothetical protein
MRRLLLLLLVLVAACGEDPPPPPIDNAPFPADYEASYVEVRNCRPSGDHDLNNIRIVVEPDAAPIYMTRTGTFAPGMIVLKEEYDFGDATCTGPIKQWTVMTKLQAGFAPPALDWKWHQVDKNRTIVGEDTPRCIGCHQLCGVPPDGFQWTCALP